MPPPSHPSTSIPPSQPTIPTSSSAQNTSPISPPSSPFHTQMGSSSRSKISELQNTKVAEIETLEKKYQRGHRQVFPTHTVEGAFPSSSAKKVDKGKKKMTREDIHEEIRHKEENLHETEMEFDLVDLNQQDDSKITSIDIKEKESNIIELQTNPYRSQFFITFLEQENQ